MTRKMLRDSLTPQAISALAEELGADPQRIASVYAQVWQEMERSAAITNFLPILVAKEVRRVFREAQLAEKEHNTLSTP